MKKTLMKSGLLMAFVVLLSFSARAQSPDDITGLWWNAEKTAKIEVYKEKGKYFGKIVHLVEPNENGKPKVDKENPDAKLKNRKLDGLVILEDLEYDEDNEYEDGKIYDPKSGKTYSANAELNGDKLDLRGYIGISLIGRTSTWERVK
ncbi:DUF2147 domain-containing protein [Nafulsella turpanensis]|uniref:DUF2147 domain-containing protein n=1 Tax=Nafulsella turpanensis TaxID=1265690 RepID=UPI00058D2A3B|nr:DUF2147 domain-containing protein [Nafulsella turpanensis]